MLIRSPLIEPLTSTARLRFRGLRSNGVSIPVSKQIGPGLRSALDADGSTVPARASTHKVWPLRQGSGFADRDHARKICVGQHLPARQTPPVQHLSRSAVLLPTGRYEIRSRQRSPSHGSNSSRRRPQTHHAQSPSRRMKISSSANGTFARPWPRQTPGHEQAGLGHRRWARRRFGRQARRRLEGGDTVLVQSCKRLLEGGVERS